MKTKNQMYIKFMCIFAFTFIPIFSAGAGILNDPQHPFSCSFPAEPAQAIHTWNFDYSSTTLTLEEKIYESGQDPVNIKGITDSDPTFHVSKSVQNKTSITWTGYELTLLGSGATFDYAVLPTSSHFQMTSQTPTKLTFYAPYIVIPGETVTLNLDVNIDTTGLFSFTLQQNPIPEPTTLLSLSFGAVLWRRKRR